MPAPTVVAAGSNATGTTSTLAPDYPAVSLLLNDVAVVVAAGIDNTALALPADWTPGDAQQDVHATFSCRWWWKRLAGGESGTVTLNCGTAGTTARMFVVRGCRSWGSPIEGLLFASGNDANPTSPAGGITIASAARLGCVLWTFKRNVATANADGSWTEVFDSGGNTVRLVPDTKSINSTEAGGDVRTIGTANPWGVWSFAFMPDHDRAGVVLSTSQMRAPGFDAHSHGAGIMLSSSQLRARGFDAHVYGSGLIMSGSNARGAGDATSGPRPPTRSNRGGVIMTSMRMVAAAVVSTARAVGQARGRGSSPTSLGLGSQPRSQGLGSSPRSRGLGS